MKNKINNFKTKAYIAVLTANATLTQAMLVHGADKGQVQQKITDAGNIIKGILSSIIVLVGICVALWIIIKRLPDADNKQEQHEVYKAVGRVMGLVALGAAIVWLLPWVYSLFV